MLFETTEASDVFLTRWLDGGTQDPACGACRLIHCLAVGCHVEVGGGGLVEEMATTNPCMAADKPL